MTQHPPHLPPKSSSLRQRAVLLTVPWLILFTALAALAAAAVSTTFLAWYVPDFVSYQVPVTVATRQQAEEARGAIDPLLDRTIEERTVLLFSRAESDGTTIAATDQLAEAVVLSSDGWIAFAGTSVPTTDVYVLDASGAVHAIETYRSDPNTDIIYAKVADGNFLITPIADWSQTNYAGAAVWIKTHAAWSSRVLSDRIVQQTDERIALEVPYASYQLSMAADTSLLFDEQGTFIGFAFDEQLIPSWHVRSALSAVLSGATIPSVSEQYTGSLLTAYLDPTSGAYVHHPAVEMTRIPRAYLDATSTLQVGDILTRVGGSPIDPFTLATLLRQQPTVALTVIRSGVYTSVVMGK